MNLFLKLKYPSTHRVTDNAAAALLAYDALQLTGLLYLTGGLENPFAFLILVPELVSASSLPIPYTIGLGLKAVPQAGERAARALGAADVSGAIHALMVKAVEQPSLKAMGLTRAALDKVADAAVKEPYDKSKPVSRDAILAMLVAAYEGARP